MGKRLWIRYKFIFWIAKHFALVTSLLRMLYQFRIRLLAKRTPYFQSRACKHSQEVKPQPDQIVYFPSCHGQIASLEPNPNSYYIQRLCKKAGLQLIIPGPIRELCCGRIFAHYSQIQAAEYKQRQLRRAVYNASSSVKSYNFCDSIACAEFAHAIVEPAAKPIVGILSLLSQVLLARIHFSSIMQHTLFIVADTHKQQRMHKLMQKMYHEDIAVLTHKQQFDDRLDRYNQPANIAIFTFQQVLDLLADAQSNYMLKIKWQMVLVQDSHQLLFSKQSVFSGHHVRSIYSWLDEFSLQNNEYNN